MIQSLSNLSKTAPQGSLERQPIERMAFASALEHDESFTTINLTMNFRRPVWTERLRAEARVVSRGKNVGYVECVITNEAAKQIAKASSTCLIWPWVAKPLSGTVRTGSRIATEGASPTWLGGSRSWLDKPLETTEEGAPGNGLLLNHARAI